MANGRGNLILLDTHIWVWSVDKNPRLSSLHAEMIEENWPNVSVSIISFWEISMLAAKGRIDLGRPTEKWFEKILDESGIIILPLSPVVTAEAYSLPGTFHDDPADRMIVATARNRDCMLLTEDSKILKYPYVQTA